MERLTEEQFRQFVRGVAVKSCPVCGSKDLHHNRHIAVTQYGPAGKPLHGVTDRRLSAYCLSCGYIMEFNAAALGL